MTVATSSLLSSEVADFLVAQGLAVASTAGRSPLPLAVAFDGRIPKMPDRLYVIAPVPGVGLISERNLDVQSFQIRTRGKAAVGGKSYQATADAEALAWAADTLLLSTPAGRIGAHYVNLVDRKGSPPTYLTYDQGSGRVHLTCKYDFYVART